MVGAVRWAAELLVTAVDAIAVMSQGARAGRGQQADEIENTLPSVPSAPAPSVPGVPSVSTSEGNVDTTPVAAPMMCHCDLPVNIWVVWKRSQVFGRTFVCCPRRHDGPQGSEQCEYFKFTDDIPPSMARNYGAYARARAAR